MPGRNLILYPDPLLRKPCVQVTDFGAEVVALSADLTETLTAVGALGLTAPHIGVLRRVVVVRMAVGGQATTYVNPVVIWSSLEVATHEEGSVSMPGIRERITRCASIRVNFQDLAGAVHETEASGFEAAVLQHEIDQLDGVFWIDRLSRLKRDRLVGRYLKLRRRG